MKKKKPIPIRCHEMEHQFVFSEVKNGKQRRCSKCKLTIVEAPRGLFGRITEHKTKKGDIKKQRL